MLYNLKAIYVQQGNSAVARVERLLLLRPDGLTEIRDRGSYKLSLVP
jgi:regulator of sirC expression with transglutaminase-like and TPR domain